MTRSTPWALAGRPSALIHTDAGVLDPERLLAAPSLREETVMQRISDLGVFGEACAPPVMPS